MASCPNSMQAGAEARRHDGRVAVERSNLYWSSDGLKISCDNRRRCGRCLPIVYLELFPSTWNQISSLARRIVDGEPDPLGGKVL